MLEWIEFETSIITNYGKMKPFMVNKNAQFLEIKDAVLKRPFFLFK
jgi:hypothetical protein